MARRQKQTPTDAAIERAYYRSAQGVQINILDISKIYAAGRAAAAVGADIEAAVVAAVQALRVN